jgi:hypothetical protein
MVAPKAPRTVARPASPECTTGVLTAVLMVVPKALRTVARPASPECTTAVPTVELMGEPMAVPTGEPQNGASRF